jgi:adenylate kinase family enzyme
MNRVAIIGNSGSGKSTLAQRLASESGSAVLDLDVVAWETGRLAVERDRGAALADVERFCTSNDGWVVEGCYADLVRPALAFGPRLIFVDPGLERCLANCRLRPWEPHKYGSKEEQDKQLEFLLGWVGDYYTRDGEMSLAAHRALFVSYDGPKEHVRTLDPPALPGTHFASPRPRESQV